MVAKLARWWWREGLLARPWVAAPALTPLTAGCKQHTPQAQDWRSHPKGLALRSFWCAIFEQPKGLGKRGWPRHRWGPQRAVFPTDGAVMRRAGKPQSA